MDLPGDEPTNVGDTRWRYQLDNHLGSSAMEIDGSAAANVISYEEFHPYGTTAFHLSSSSSEVSAKRYRYTGKEKDSETGLYYHGARYYAAWLGRWTAVDPIQSGHPYAYVGNNPTNFVDPDGRRKRPPPGAKVGIFTQGDKGKTGVVRTPRPQPKAKPPTPPPEDSNSGGFGVGIDLNELTDPNDPLNPHLDLPEERGGGGAPGAGSPGSNTSSGGDTGGAEGSDDGSGNGSESGSEDGSGAGGADGTGDSDGSGGGEGAGGEGKGPDDSFATDLAKTAQAIQKGNTGEKEGSKYGAGGSAEKGALLDNPIGQLIASVAIIADAIATVVSLGKLAFTGLKKAAQFIFQKGLKPAAQAIGKAFGKVKDFFKGLFKKGRRQTAKEIGDVGEDLVAADIGVPRNAGPGRTTVPGTGPGGFRVPDFDPNLTIAARGTVVEVKNVSGKLKISDQIRDLVAYAQSRGVPLEIFTNADLPRRGELARLIRQGQIIISPIP